MEKEKVPNAQVLHNVYEPICVPELNAFIDYSQAPGMSPGEDRKPIPITTNTSPTPQTNNNFLHEGES